MPLGIELGLGPGDFVLHGDIAVRKNGKNSNLAGLTTTFLAFSSPFDCEHDNSKGFFEDFHEMGGVDRLWTGKELIKFLKFRLRLWLRVMVRPSPVVS